MNEKGILDYIRISQLKRLLYPLVLLVLSALILFNLPIFDYFKVTTVTADAPLSEVVDRQNTYVRTSAHDLYYTGEDYYVDGILTGHYYYQLIDNYCRFYILRPSAGKPAEAYIATKTITGRLVKLDENAESLIESFAEDLEWSTEGLLSISDAYLVNEVIYFPFAQRVLFGLVLIFSLIGLLGVLYSILMLTVPRFSPTYLRLKKYGDARKLLRDTDEELASHTLLKEGNMVLTPKFLVEFSADQSAIIPLVSVLWVFETSRMRFVLKERREKMFYSMRIVTIAGDTFIIRDKKKSDIKAIEELLTDRYPNFFYGYSDEHDKMVRYILSENKAELKANRKAKKLGGKSKK